MKDSWETGLPMPFRDLAWWQLYKVNHKLKVLKLTKFIPKHKRWQKKKRNAQANVQDIFMCDVRLHLPAETEST